MGAKVTAPAAELAKISNVDRAVGEGDIVAPRRSRGDGMEVPAHTAGHIAYLFADDVPAHPCRRHAVRHGLRTALFEGTAPQMFRNIARLV